MAYSSAAIDIRVTCTSVDGYRQNNLQADRRTDTRAQRFVLQHYVSWRATTTTTKLHGLVRAAGAGKHRRRAGNFPINPKVPKQVANWRANAPMLIAPVVVVGVGLSNKLQFVSCPVEL